MSEFSKFNGWIGPQNLLGLVRNTAPFLFDAATRPEVPPPTSSRLIELGEPPRGWLNILALGEKLSEVDESSKEDGGRGDYFALCLACHHATVATFVPTDVDSKIRGHLWQD